MTTTKLLRAKDFFIKGDLVTSSTWLGASYVVTKVTVFRVFIQPADGSLRPTDYSPWVLQIIDKQNNVLFAEPDSNKWRQPGKKPLKTAYQEAEDFYATILKLGGSRNDDWTWIKQLGQLS